jgi:hypothetical protein
MAAAKCHNFMHTEKRCSTEKYSSSETDPKFLGAVYRSCGKKSGRTGTATCGAYQVPNPHTKKIV